MAAQIKVLSLPPEHAAAIEALGKHLEPDSKSGVSAAGRYIIGWFLRTVPANELRALGIEPPPTQDTPEN